MKKSTQPNLANYFNLPNPGLRAYFLHVTEGQTEDYRPPFWEGKSREEVVSQWTEVFDSLDVDSKMPGLKAFELGMKTKVGPLSVQAPLSERIPSIEQYYTAIQAKSQPLNPQAIEAVKKSLMPVRGIRLRSQVNTVRNMRLSTNSGNPYFQKRRAVVQKSVPATLLRSEQDTIYQLLASGKRWPVAAVLGWRGQEGGPEKDDVKQRVVWMFPFSVNVCELQAYQPMIEAWQKANINSAYVSLRAVEVKITRFFDTKGDNYCIVTDFSKFDQHFNSDLQDAAKEIEAFMLTPSRETEEWLENVYPVKFNIPLICSDKLMYFGTHGMGSGSGGTNFDECCAHAALQHEVAILKGKTLNPYSNAYGDDGYLSYEGIDVDDVISTYESHGQEMNPDKQDVDKHSAVYLRRYFHDSYRDKEGIMLGVYSTFRALGRLLGQERFYDPDEWGPKMVELRALSILENCANSPIFEQFVDFVMKGDKYRLGLDIPGFLDSLPSEVKRATELIPDFLGYTKTLQQDDATGISNWRVVKYLKSKA